MLVVIVPRGTWRVSVLLHHLNAHRSLFVLLLLQAAAAELARLEASRARVVSRVHSLEGHLGRLVDEEATLLEQRTEGEAGALVAVMIVGNDRWRLHCIGTWRQDDTAGAAHRG
jgi:hypothetical protein